MAMQEISKYPSIPSVPADIQEKVLVEGNLKDLTVQQRLTYINALCESLGLNPLTRPFEYITLNQKLTLYARKDATDQLRRIYGISIEKVETKFDNGLCNTLAYARTPDGRTDSDLGVVNIKNLQGDALANASMKAITKAKRRVTLSICGLGILDESEIETIPEARIVNNQELNVTTKKPDSHKDNGTSKNNVTAIEHKKDDNDFLKRISEASTMEELKHIYKEAYKFAVEIKDKEALNAFTIQKDARKSELEELNSKQISEEFFGDEEGEIK